MHDWKIGRELAHGMRLRPELHASGLDDKAIARAVRRGELQRFRTGAYMPGGVLETLAPVDRHRLLTRTVLLQSRTDSVVSHISALAEWEVPVWGSELDHVHLTRLDQRAGRVHRDVVQHRGELGPDDVVHRHGLDVTSGTRTALDLCCVLGQEAAVVAVGALIHAGHTTPELLADRYQSLVRRPGQLGTQVVLRVADGRCESVGEWRTAYALWRLGVPTPEPQFEIRDEGRLLYRLDFAWPDRGVWLEFDGKQKYHQHLRPGESPLDAVLREKAREDDIRARTGWVCLRITWADLEDPKRLLQKIQAAFALAAGAASGRGA